jgi:hypothetical protein
MIVTGYGFVIAAQEEIRVSSPGLQCNVSDKQLYPAIAE